MEGTSRENSLGSPSILQLGVAQERSHAHFSSFGACTDLSRHNSFSKKANCCYIRQRSTKCLMPVPMTTPSSRWSATRPSPRAWRSCNSSSAANPSAQPSFTITNDGSSRYAILKHGCVVPTLATARPGSLRGHDIRANAALTAGCATHIEWWASQTQAPSTSNSPSRSPAPGAGKQHTAISLTAPCVQGIAS